MMKDNTLVLITATFPFGKRESYLENEIGHLAAAYSKVYILAYGKTSDIQRPVPANCTVISFESKGEKAPVLSFLSIADILKETAYILSRQKPQDWLMSLRTLGSGIKQLPAVYAMFTRFIKEYNIDFPTTTWYCYWLDYFAVGLALAKKNNQIRAAVSRAHNWDVYYDIHAGNYLPFRNLLVQQLDRVYTISENARSYILSKTSSNYAGKIKVARLGTENAGLLKNPAVSENVFVLCSCSTLIKRKRIDKIMEAITLLNIGMPIIWYHIGEEGDAKESLYSQAKAKTTAQKQLIMLGHIDNKKILDFYTSTHIDLFINVSESEGVPVSIMEVNSAGLPALATNIGGVAEVVNSSNGILVDVNCSPADIANAIQQYYNLPAATKQQYRQMAFETWNEKYNADKNTRPL